VVELGVDRFHRREAAVAVDPDRLAAPGKAADRETSEPLLRAGIVGDLVEAASGDEDFARRQHGELRRAAVAVPVHPQPFGDRHRCVAAGDEEALRHRLATGLAGVFDLGDAACDRHALVGGGVARGRTPDLEAQGCARSVDREQRSERHGGAAVVEGEGRPDLGRAVGSALGDGAFGADRLLELVEPEACGLGGRAGGSGGSRERKKKRKEDERARESHA
jgi:hypothetical protein